jgi:hypothetical protein
MSDTTYVHEVTRVRGLRVALTMDADEVRALAGVAAAAIDASVLIDGDVSPVVTGNAQKIFEWSLRTAEILDLTHGITGSDSDKE